MFYSPFLAVMKREFKRVLTRPLYIFCIIVAPLICYVFFITLMYQGLPTGLPLGLVDDDMTADTRQIERNLDAFQQTDIARQYANVTEARKALQRGQIYGFYYIPEGTTRKLLRFEQAKVSFYSNYSYMIAGSLVYRDMKMMSELASGAAARSIMYAKGVSQKEAMAQLQPIVVNTYPIGNPWLNYNVYLSNILIPGMLMIFIFMITVHSFGVELKEKTSRQLIHSANESMVTVLCGKLTAHFLLFFFMGIIYNIVLYQWMHFPCNDGIGSMIFATAAFIMASQGFGVLAITMIPSLRLALSLASLWGVLSFSICGMSFPAMAMNPGLQGLAWLFPLRHYYLIYVNCALDGYSCANVWQSFAALACFIFVPVLCMPRLRRILIIQKYVP